MKKIVMSTLVIAAGFVALRAEATQSNIGATQCHYPGSSQSASTTYDGSATIWNSSSTSAASLACVMPMASRTNVLITSATVYYNNNGGTNANVPPTNCSLLGVSPTGTYYGSSQKWACSTAGGCTSYAPPYFLGNGNLSWTNPFGATAISSLIGVSYSCSLPPSNTNGQAMMYGMNVDY
jgi:hypothetical protein